MVDSGGCRSKIRCADFRFFIDVFAYMVIGKPNYNIPRLGLVVCYLYCLRKYFFGVKAIAISIKGINNFFFIAGVLIVK